MPTGVVFDLRPYRSHRVHLASYIAHYTSPTRTTLPSASNIQSESIEAAHIFANDIQSITASVGLGDEGRAPDDQLCPKTRRRSYALSCALD